MRVSAILGQHEHNDPLQGFAALAALDWSRLARRLKERMLNELRRFGFRRVIGNVETVIENIPA